MNILLNSVQSIVEEKCRKQFPATLYRYYAGDTPYLEQSVTGGLYFACPFEFNDPFDCQIPYVENNYCKINKEKIKHIIDECEAEVNYDDIQKSLNNSSAVRSLYRSQINHLGILCMTKHYDNILMWSHYAKHSGVCIAYDMNTIMSYLSEHLHDSVMQKYPHIQHWNYSSRLIHGNVIYDSTLGTSVPLFLEDKERAFEKYWHKSKDWSYEDEYRIGVSLGSKISITVPYCVRHIYLGCNVKICDISKIYNILRNKNMANIPISIMSTQSGHLSPVLIPQTELERIASSSHRFWDEYEMLLYQKK